MTLHLPFKLVLKIQHCKYDAEHLCNYLDIVLFKKVSIKFSINGVIIDTNKIKLIQVFSMGFRYRKHSILVKL